MAITVDGYRVEKVGWDHSSLPRTGKIGMVIRTDYDKVGSKWVLKNAKKESFTFKNIILMMADSEQWKGPGIRNTRSFNYTSYGYIPTKLSVINTDLGVKTVWEFFFKGDYAKFTTAWTKYGIEWEKAHTSKTSKKKTAKKTTAKRS